MESHLGSPGGVPGNTGRTNQAVVTTVMGLQKGMHGMLMNTGGEGGRDSAVREGLQRTDSEPTSICAGRDGRL